MHRRPTLPIADWRIATHLQATRAIQGQEGTPAYRCQCTDCSDWRRHWHRVLPADLAGGLRRACIALDQPTDLYVFDHAPTGNYCRVNFHLVGKILSGPEVWFEREDGSPILNYRDVPGPEGTVSIAIYPHEMSLQQGPRHPDRSSGNLILVDMRLTLPPREAA